MVALVAFQALWSSADSFLLVWATLVGDVGFWVAMKEEEKLSTAMVDTSLAGLFAPVELSFEEVYVG